MVCESRILMPTQTQYLPVAGISPTDLWISQTDDERTAREARMSASWLNTHLKVYIYFLNPQIGIAKKD